jgi:hypothetical protein
MSSGIPAMLRPFAAVAAFASVLSLPALAQLQAAPRADIDALVAAMALPDLLEIMHQEGLGYGEQLQADLLQGRGGTAWTATVEGIYDPARMQEMVRRSLQDDLDASQISAITKFLRSDTGREIVGHEIAARRALLDDDVEATAHDTWLELEAEGGRRWDMLVDFAEVNDLIESNVAGAMTSNYAFYRGLAEGGAFNGDLAEDQILSDVWNREQEIREDTTNWVFSFTSLAYQPLTDDQFQAYIDFARSGPGQAMNTALFTAFNDMFTGISRDLGRSASRVLAGQDI